MLVFLLRRLMQACFVMIIISVISFAIQGKLGDPVQQMVGMSALNGKADHTDDDHYKAGLHQAA